MSKLLEVLMRIMVIINLTEASVMYFGGNEQRATCMMVLAIFGLLVAMDLERGRYGR